jgi:hypothetical protein
MDSDEGDAVSRARSAMAASVVQTSRGFAYNNAWANHRLLSACANLSQEEFEARRTGFFSSLQRTLNHIDVIDLFYIDALEGGWLGPKAWENTVPYQANRRGSSIDPRNSVHDLVLSRSRIAAAGCGQRSFRQLQDR